MSHTLSLYVINLGGTEIFWPLLLLLSVGVGALSGLLGVGGGFILVPFLSLLGVPYHMAVSGSYGQILASSIIALYQYQRQRHILWRPALILIGGSAIGTFLGVRLFNFLLAQEILGTSLDYGFILLLMGAILLLFLKPQAQNTAKTHHHFLIFTCIGISIGLLSGLMGIGGGFLIVPCLIYFINLPPLRAKAISQLNIFFTAMIAILLHGIMADTIHLYLACLLGVGGILGSLIGLKCDKFLSDKTSKYIFIAILFTTMLLLVYKVLCL